MIQNGLILTGRDAELLSRVLEEVKTKALEESEVSLDDTQALSELLTSFRGEQKEPRKQTYNPFSKRLFLGTIIARQHTDGFH